MEHRKTPWLLSIIVGLAIPLASMAQDPLWMIGNTAVHFPQEPNSAIRSSALPTSYHDDIPDAFEYQGQVAQIGQNVQYDEYGNVLFFIVDGNVYDRNGMLLADRALSFDDLNCQTCFLPGQEIHIIPVAGSCTRYHIISLHFRQGPGQNGTMRWGVLDLTLESDLSAYADACVPVKGRFMYHSELLQEEIQMIGMGFPTEIVPEYSPFEGLGSFYDATFLAAEFNADAIHAASVQVGPDGRHLFVVRCNQTLSMFQLDQNGVRRLVGYGGSYTWPFSYPNGADIWDMDYLFRGELAIHLQNNLLQIAHSGYIHDEGSHELRIGYWRFQLTQGEPLAVSLVPFNSDNPRAYRLDYYDENQPPLDISGNPILRPAISGLEFAPNGQFLYFVKSSNFNHWIYGGASTTFGYVDLSITGSTPEGPFTYVGYAPAEQTRELADTQLGVNVGPNGSGKALYMLYPYEDEYRMAAFLDPDQPNVANMQMNVLQLSEIAVRQVPNVAPEYRLLNHRVANSTQFQRLQQPFCCEDLVKARDGSTLITPALCDLTWLPGNNAFWNTLGPVYIFDTLRIASGAHVQATGLTFKFAEDAVLIIEPGASLTGTNCTFTNACEDTRWMGIQVWGRTTQHQFGSPHPTHQGKLELRGCTVENAETGIVTSRGLQYKPNTGGVVRTSRAWITEVVDPEADPPTEVSYWRNTIIRNCRTGIKFYPYQNRHPQSEAPMANLSRFRDTEFMVTDAYPVDYDFEEHAWLWGIDGIPFSACRFENTLPDEYFAITGPYPGSQHLGHGIRSYNAHYRVSSTCSGTTAQQGVPCPDPETRFSQFIGLDHGIHAVNGPTSLRNFVVNRVKFTDNIAGVYAEGVVGYVVKNSNFSIGNRNVAMTNLDETNWFDAHRGIYSKRSYGFAVDDNTLYKTPESPNDRKTEGIVIGYSQDHNDYVFRNHGSHLSKGFIGEGVSASLEPSYTPTIGLQMICNTNQNNDVNLSSRKANGESNQQQASHTIRAQQGDSWRQADNEFDGWVGWLNKKDFEVTTTYAIIKYWHQGQTAPYKPQSYDDYLAPHLVNPPLADNCVSKLHPFLPAPPQPGMPPHDVWPVLLNKKLAYGTSRYLYEQLIDGGNTDEVVQEITAAWSQDAWTLRASLLARSPYLSTIVLKELNIQNKLPAAMYAEVCIANPEATQADGFYQWLERDAPHPLPEYLLASIVASWDQHTYRSTLEAQMAGHHAAMSQAANLMLELYTTDSIGHPVDSLRAVWQQVRTPAARYAEALSYLAQGQYTAATTVVAAIPAEHTRLDPKDLTEKDRMLGLVGFLQSVAGDGREEDELSPAEQDQLEALIAGEQDRPATWAQNLLCFHYGRCVAPWTGDDGSEPKSLPKPQHIIAVPPVALTLQPNPTATWSVANVSLGRDDATAILRVLDLLGKEVASYRLAGKEKQVVIDTRELKAGEYIIELRSGSERLGTDRLVVLP